MNSANGAAVVVGVDGSQSALRAVRLAAAEADRRNRPLRIVHGFIWPLLHVPLQPPAGGPPGSGLREQAERLVAEAVAEAEAAVPGLRISGEIIDGEAAAVLLGESPAAAMIVLGDRGLGGFSALLVGSVAVQVASYADCPVLVARGTDRADGPIVVGVDGSEMSRLAAEFAVEEASVRGAEVLALHAYRHPVSTGPGDMQPLVYDDSELRTEEERLVAEVTAGLADRWPDVPITRRTVRGRPAPVLTDASRQAQLVVVGRQGRGEFTGLLLGSVSQAVLHHADCPVAVVRAPR
ncbi:universal stress protein [Micromonospora sp. S4605]|uniref:Nucleotide-binding universal stress protein, UspA family n=1 Tax=Micromonospora echinaurantiaca TaxID=47857 RepID=A0A1C5HXQ2_9ACTN|nr:MULTISPECIES: universal stress protein [Micromonospora]PWU53764.1 universal stress protein [Micromonospora sp. S4605]SCG50742.1 Nucleotide-binding universal stress protein, UspA family [Micromonospora echinaurantiaca]